MISSSLNQLARQEKTRREILHKSDLVPPLPDLVTRLLGLLHHQDTEPRDLELLLQNDQVLVAKMLAMVNSPFYGLNRAVNTVCLLYTSPSPRDATLSRMPSSA